MAEEKNKTKKSDSTRTYTVKKTVTPKKKTDNKKTSGKNTAHTTGVPAKLKPYLLIAVAIIFVLVFFIPESTPVVKITKKPLMGLLGVSAYFVPIYFIVFAVFLHRYSENGDIKNEKIWITVVNIISVAVLAHLFTTDKADRVFSVSTLWTNGTKHIGCGVIGGMLGTAMYKFMTGVISYIVFGFLCFVTTVFLFGSTPKAVYMPIYRRCIVPLGRYLKSVPGRIARAAETSRENRQRAAEAEEKTEEKVKTPEVKIEEPAAPPYVPEKAEKTEEPEQPERSEPASQIDGLLDEEEESREEEPVETETEEIPLGSQDAPKYTFPPISLLTKGDLNALPVTPEMIQKTGDKLIEVLAAYNVRAKVVSTSIGPTVTRYEVEPQLGIRVSSIARLTDDIALHLAAKSIRIEAPIPGMSAVGIEIPNQRVQTVRLRDMIETPEFKNHKSKLFICLGLDVAGNRVYFDIYNAPHLLIAGATGMGKSVCINSLILSLLYRATPDEVKFILIDPKKVEFSCYEGLPHLLVPVVTKPEKAAGTLNWAVMEMERRFEILNEVNARNLAEYNSIVEDDPEREKLSAIVIIIDELADLMMAASSDVETAICRLAAKARAAGMHLIVGTQRPSADIITGLIKANMPSRIAFTVVSQVDSRIILDTAGAEKLLGRGDMLFSPIDQAKQTRIQGTFVDGKTEVTAVCEFIKKAAASNYDENVIKLIEEETLQCGNKKKKAKEDGDDGDDSNKKIDSDAIKALEVAFEDGTLSTSLLQRRLSMGYSRAARAIDKLERCGYIGKLDPSTKKRPILISGDEFLELKSNFDSEGE